MTWQHTIYAYPTLIATAVSLVLAVYTVLHIRRHEPSPTTLSFVAMNVAIVIWTLFSAIKLLSTDPLIKFQAYRLLYLGGGSIGPFLLLFTLAYTDRTRWLRRRFVVGLFVVPIVFWTLLFTNPYDLVTVETYLVDVDGLVVLRTTTGPAYAVFSFTYALVMALLTLAVLLSETIKQGRSYLPQSVLMVIAVVTPVLVSFLTSANVPPFTLESVNFVPASAVISSIALGVATFRYRMLDLRPIARRTVIEHSPDGVLVLDRAKRVVHANDTAATVLGPASPAVGNSLEEVFPGFDLETASTVTLDRSSSTGAADFLEIRSQPLRRQGDHVGWVLVLRDVTTRIRRERDLENFTSVVSHDIREPLRTIENYLDLLEDNAALEEGDRELLTTAKENSRQLQGMVTDLLQYSQLDAGEESFDRVDCDRVVADVLETLQFEIEDRDATVVVDDLPTVVGNDHQLRRLFRNLLTNALKYTDDSPEIQVTVDELETEWAFTVADDGIGIESSDLERIFDLFTRADRTDSASGSGVGLAVCKKIVEQHGGQISIESTPGDGTEVTFTIPQPRLKSDRPVSPRPSPSHSG
ncbi:sensor histidine kinase [Natrarchaeobius chitinivorans]|nr:histidine kinase N-terminal 7TM domain-containing protein [Natrarchaeobius chitinivorans]